MPLLFATFVAIGASLLAPAASAAPVRAVSVRSSFPVRVLNQRRIQLRDAACPRCTAQRQRLLALAASGIGVGFTMQRPGSTMSLTDLVNMVAGPMRSAVDAVEGPNEYDHAGDPNWVANLRAYQQQLY